MIDTQCSSQLHNATLVCEQVLHLELKIKSNKYTKEKRIIEEKRTRNKTK